MLAFGPSLLLTSDLFIAWNNLGFGTTENNPQNRPECKEEPLVRLLPQPKTLLAVGILHYEAPSKSGKSIAVLHCKVYILPRESLR